ncbi:hypothetical protein BGW80DRAFT_1338145, partial [Lactifluus volemus]
VEQAHNFLLRHVYGSRISDSAHRFLRWCAMLTTVLLSAAAHELVMAVVTKKITKHPSLLFV